MDFDARLVVYGISKMPVKSVRALCVWLRKLADDLEKDPRAYSNRFTAKHMK